jgi:hypothetical protein
MRFLWWTGLAAAGLLGAVAGAAPVRANEAASGNDSRTIEEIVDVLRDNGLINEAEKTRLLAKHAAERKSDLPAVAAAATNGWVWSGDMRLRHESFAFDDDDLGNDTDNRYRGRYRARIGVKKQFNDSMLFGFRLASGTNDLRSTNTSLGGDPDFGPDGIFIDRAFIDFGLTDGKNGGVATKFSGGKVDNPYVGKVGKDFLVFDQDINLEGLSFLASFKPDEETTVYFNTGGYIADENSTSSDPKLIAAQFGAASKVADGVELGFRVSGYEWRSLDGRFIDTASSFGNLANFTDSDRDLNSTMGEVFTHLKLSGSADWPIVVYGTVVKNFDADSAVIDTFAVGEEDLAWGAGIEFGSSKIVKFGVAYFEVEANSVVAQFTDSDLFDGFTNREGFMVYLSREIAKNAEFKLTLFSSDTIEDTGLEDGPFASSLANGDRLRLQADLEFGF